MANKTSDAAIYSAVYIGVETVIGISAVFGNILVIWAVRLKPSLQNTTFYFIVSLALADLAVGFLVMPLAIVLSLEINFHFHLCLFICCLIIILTNASILSLLAIAVDRYLQIKIPTRYRAVITSRRICFSICTVWIISFLVGMVPMFGWNKRSRLGEEHQHFLNCTFENVMSIEYIVNFYICGWIFIPLIIMLMLYIEIFYLIKKQLKQNSSNHIKKGVFYGKEYKTAKSLALVLLLFALCWLPLSILHYVQFYNPSVKKHTLYQPTIFLFILLSHANSAMNPIIYAFKINKFKEAYIHILRTILMQKSEEPANAEHTMEEISQDQTINNAMHT
ncbi:adenosine receptor A3 isoform X1 [Xenopus laevis]|uniref:Adenosine receptor A3 n=2 Tax=Xenopus laevis TaxID=8355 RepID=A0A974DQ73_XENLA|nr:adenosine receptor A3 isoform X1 [Xenopus laevis]OCT94677.1 hypothetical protein XELAEV_18012362mg [Xenopus laevis]